MSIRSFGEDFGNPVLRSVIVELEGVGVVQNLSFELVKDLWVDFDSLEARLVRILDLLPVILELLVGVETILFGIVQPGLVFVLGQLLLESVDSSVNWVGEDILAWLAYFAVSGPRGTI
jgi:hypothetical protein